MVMDLKGVNVVKVEVEEVGETEVEIKEKVVERCTRNGGTCRGSRRWKKMTRKMNMKRNMR